MEAFLAEFIWQRRDWPRFRWNADRLLPAVADARFLHGRLIGTMVAAGLETRQQAELAAATEDALATSAIEGEMLPPASVRSSIARRLGLPDGGLAAEDSRAAGVADMVLDATRHCQAKLTEDRLFGWHRSLFAAASPSLEAPLDIGCWRTDAHGPMQVVSGTYRGGKPPRVHFEAPPAGRVPAEMARFLAWFAAEAADQDGLVRAGLAHLWFVTVHPFDDGNGRIGRAIADMAIARAEPTGGRRFYSLSSAILRQRRAYYDALERAQRGDLDITDWLIWFLQCHQSAVGAAEAAAQRVIDIARFWPAVEPVNARQRKALGRMLDGWEGLMTTRKWAAMNGVSADTAQRDIADLVARGILVPTEKGGRSTGYLLVGAVGRQPLHEDLSDQT
ncbi:MAG TPA: Fic family protein [Rhodopila sp.]|nr:Fic family protein [Rhodopila sp.]